MEPKRFIPHAKPLPEKARKVRGGLKIASDWPMRLSWAASQWVAGVSRAAAPDAMAQGVEYAKLGQVRTFSIEPGRVTGEVQGRQFRPHKAVLEFGTFSDAHWHAVETAMTEQAVYAAKLLAHEVPENIQDVFSPQGLWLYPTLEPEATDLKASCTCGHPTPWCKHVVCTALLLAERMDKNAFLIFTLRGLSGEELIERLRSRRAAAQGGDMFTQSLSQRLSEVGSGRRAAGATEEMEPDAPEARRPDAPLDACVARFWEMGPGLEELETPLRPPEVSHALLRRLGPSPFKEGKFPLVGLLATCYETISRAALESGVSTDPEHRTDESSEAPSRPGHPHQ